MFLEAKFGELFLNKSVTPFANFGTFDNFKDWLVDIFVFVQGPSRMFFVG
jgi:hypothetical protein